MTSPPPAEVEVPDVVGFPAIDAVEILTRAGLSPVGPNASQAPECGTVSAQHPVGTALAVTGSAVVLHTETGGPLEPDLAPPPEQTYPFEVP